MSGGDGTFLLLCLTVPACHLLLPRQLPVCSGGLLVPNSVPTTPTYLPVHAMLGCARHVPARLLLQACAMQVISHTAGMPPLLYPSAFPLFCQPSSFPQVSGLPAQDLLCCPDTTCQLLGTMQLGGGRRSAARRRGWVGFPIPTPTCILVA